MELLDLENIRAIERTARELDHRVPKQVTYFAGCCYNASMQPLGREVICPRCGGSVCYEHSNTYHYRYCNLCGQRLQHLANVKEDVNG